MQGTFRLFFMGGEQAGMRATLRDEGVTNLGVSFAGLERRMPKKRRKVAIEDWGFEHVFLDSGGHSANSNPGKRTVGEWEDYAAAYQAFIEENIDGLSMVTEFDCAVLGPSWIEKQRRGFYSQLDREMFLPIWHPEEGLTTLEAMSHDYPRIGVHESAFSGSVNINGRLNALARRGTWLHGVGVSRSEVLRQVDFSSAASTTWLSATRFGETMVWDGNRLLRYPKKMKDQARMRHRSLFERAGFDADLISEDNAREVTRLSIWSWLQVEHDTQRYRLNSPPYRPNSQGGGTNTPESGTDVDRVETMDLESGNDVSTSSSQREPVIERETVTLPVLAVNQVEAFDSESKETRQIPVASISGTSSRVCNDCFVRDRCPGFKPDNTCAYDIPVEARTPEQRKALASGLLQMQTQRVAFMRFVEELNGGYADPSLSQEIDRLLKTFTTVADLEDNRDIFRMHIEARGKTGAISRLFGADVAAAITEEQGPPGLGRRDTDNVIDGVLDGRKTATRR